MKTMDLRRSITVLAIILAIICCFLAPYAWIVSSSFKNQLTLFGDVTPLSWRAFFPVDGPSRTTGRCLSAPMC